MEIKYIEKVAQMNSGKNLKYAIFTMGCQLNENDSERICGMLEEMNYKKAEKVGDANIVVFNTCCVRENAEDRLFGKLGEMKRLKEAKGTIIAIGGCMMQEKVMVEKINNSYPYVDVIFGTHTLHKLPEDIYRVLINSKRVEDIIDIDGEIIEGFPIKRNDNIKASVTIMNGCNNFCTYCIVPYVRGRERSRNPQDIIDEVQDLANKGYKEITLLGQNVNSYLVSKKINQENISYNVVISNKNNVGNCNNQNYESIKEKECERLTVNSFATLLRAINRIDGIERIRFISPHPKDFTDDVIDAIRDCDKVCKLIHLPLQSGSTEILNKMNRKYTKEQYLNLAKKIKEKIPEVAFSTDIIVGFPGETEEDFEDTIDVVNQVKFEQIFMFIYSIRIGTPAEKMENQVLETIKHERFDRLKKLYEELVAERNKEYVSTVQKILVEGKSKTNSNVLTGRTESNKVINFEGSDELIGKVIKLKIVSEHMWYLKGEKI